MDTSTTDNVGAETTFHKAAKIKTRLLGRGAARGFVAEDNSTAVLCYLWNGTEVEWNRRFFVAGTAQGAGGYPVLGCDNHYGD
jgi:hypothetical protein